MDIVFFLIILLAIGIGFWFVVRTLKQKPEEKPQNDQSLILLQSQLQNQQNQLHNQLNELTRTLDMKLGNNEKAIRDQFGASMKIVGDVQRELTKVIEGNKQVVSVTDELKNLQDILKNPKQRGVLGEYYLETVLKNVLGPGQFQMQYGFKDGTIVDAVVITREGIIPIDSKFSLDNYNRMLEASEKADRDRFEVAFSNDLKLRIDETAKYVKPEEGTLEFAFMFIPSEAIYYDLLTRKIGTHGDTNLIEYAAGKKKVIVVSPTTFLAYLQTVLQGLRRLHIEEAAQKITERVNELGKHLMTYEEYMQKLGRSLSNSVSAYNGASKEFKKIDKDVYRITGEAIGSELPLLEKPGEDADADSLL
jgi:DNA recombination protein RmuC